jgi:hypothetical protein
MSVTHRLRTVSLRSILAMAIGIAWMAVVTPSVEARTGESPTLKPEVVVENFGDSLDLAYEQYEDAKEALQMEIVNEIQAAADEGDLKRVLKLEKQYTKRIGKTIKPYRSAVTKALKPVLKQLKKQKADPSFADQARALADQGRGYADEFERQLRFQIDNAVEAAVSALTR